MSAITCSASHFKKTKLPRNQWRPIEDVDIEIVESLGKAIYEDHEFICYKRDSKNVNKYYIILKSRGDAIYYLPKNKFYDIRTNSFFRDITSKDRDLFKDLGHPIPTNANQIKFRDDMRNKKNFEISLY